MDTLHGEQETYSCQQMCANGLAKAGVNVRIVDKRPEAIPAGQADGIQPRTIEVLQV